MKTKPIIMHLTENSVMRNERSKKNLHRKTRAAMKIAALNMRGQRSSNPILPPNKWQGINQMIKKTK